jgi:hypothetical protein
MGWKSSSFSIILAFLAKSRKNLLSRTSLIESASHLETPSVHDTNHKALSMPVEDENY